MITQGKWEVRKGSGGMLSVYGDTDVPGSICACGCDFEREPQNKEHAEFIAEAGTVYNETGLTPKQLAEQRVDLLAACKDLQELYIQHAEVCKTPDDCPYVTSLEKAIDAIAKAEQN